MRRIIRNFDAWLRSSRGVFEFTQDADCLLRLRLGRLHRPVDLPAWIVPAGSVFLELHLWNEHIPPITAQGPDLEWASHTRCMLLRSFRSAGQYAIHLKGTPRPQAVGAATVLIPFGDPSGAGSFLTRLGFHLIPAYRPLGSFGEFWENLYTWALMWTYNPASLRSKQLLRIHRMEAWMTFGDFLRRYASNSPAA